MIAMARDKRLRRSYEAETAVARYLGAERMAGSGRRDLDGGWYSVEVKERASLPLWLTGGMEQAERLARGDQVAILVLHPLGWRQDDDLLVVRLRDGREILRRAGSGE